MVECKEALQRLEEGGAGSLYDKIDTTPQHQDRDSGAIVRPRYGNNGGTGYPWLCGGVDCKVQYEYRTVETHRLTSRSGGGHSTCHRLYSHKRLLSKSILHELQAILTRHQETTTAIDPLGNRF